LEVLAVAQQWLNHFCEQIQLVWQPNKSVSSHPSDHPELIGGYPTVVDLQRQENGGLGKHHPSSDGKKVTGKNLV
jgi:hypothetical protein